MVGNGNVAQARHFAEERTLPFPLYTDPSLTTYEAAGMKRGMTLMGITTLKVAARAAKAGFSQGATEGDPWQQGGAHVILPDGRVVFSQISDVAGDHFDPEAALAALSRAWPTPR